MVANVGKQELGINSKLSPGTPPRPRARSTDGLLPISILVGPLASEISDLQISDLTFGSSPSRLRRLTQPWARPLNFVRTRLVDGHVRLAVGGLNETLPQ